MPTHINRVPFLGIEFDRATIDEVVGQLSQATCDTPFAYVVTPNVDHVVRLNREHEDELGPIYENADLCVCDSRIVQKLARLNGIDLTLVPGSDLTARLFAEIIRPGDRLAVVGGTADLVHDLMRRYPNIEFFHHIPPMGLRCNAAAQLAAAAFIAAVKPRFTFLAVGSPQQEMVAAAALAHGGATGTGLCIGASLEFITGAQTRAPKILQNLSLEWAYRLWSNPKRLWRRYLIEGPRIFALAWRFRRSDSAS